MLPRGRSPWTVLAGAMLALVAVLVCAPARAQVAKFDGRTLFFHEPAPRSSMTVYAPAAELTVTPWEFLKVSAGWEADIVSGASEKVKAGPVYGRLRGPDIVSSASVHDFRNVEHGTVTIKRDTTQLTVGYANSSEHDYKSQSFNASARTDLFEHNTQLEIAYARDWDRVCDLHHAAGAGATLRQPLDRHEGCFQPNDPQRSEHPIRSDSFQATWAQAWTPVLATQLIYTGQLQNGFLSNPYRAVVLSLAGQYAQEHHPENRARQSLTLRTAYFIRPLKGALRLGLRAYRDTWGIGSGTVELEAEKYVASWLRVRARGRYYQQGEATFFSDDYTGGGGELGPRGQYFTGDRELSPFSSWLVGLRVLGTWDAGERRIASVFQQLQAGISADLLSYRNDHFTLAGNLIEDTHAYVGSLSVTAVF